MNAKIELEGISKHYGDVVAVRDASLSVREGEVFGILGPSGAGKSTLLKLVDLLEAPDSGSVSIDGERVDARLGTAHETRKHIGMVLQKPVVLNRSVWNNLAFPLRLRGWDEEEIERKVESELLKLGLHERRGKNARILSGGEMQRLCFSRATIHDPSILLLDEFAANLDPANVVLLEDQVRQYLSGKNDRTVMIVTHNLFQAKRMCDRIALMWNGDVVEVADRERFFSEPDDPRTSAFVKGELVY
jgi:tungstate transport system ATP-binding protein